jgi:hypothetical protein
MAHLDRPIEEQAHVGFEALAGRTDDLLCLTAGGEGALARLYAEDQPGAAADYCAALEKLFPDRLYIEICRRNDATEARAEDRLIDLAYARGLPLVATNPTCFAEPGFHEAHDVMLCIADSAYVESADRRRSSNDAWMKPAAEMERLFADLPEAIANTLVVAQRCAVMAPKRKPILPSLAGDIEGEAQMLRDMATAGLEARLEKAGIADEAARQPYLDRLEFELGIINQMGFPGYFPDRRGLHQVGQGQTTFRWGRGAVRARAAWSLGRSPSPISIRSHWACCSNASSIPNACRCRTSISTSAKPARRGDPLCAAEIWRGSRRADHHLRKAESPRGAADTGRVLADELWAGRPAVQAGAQPSDRPVDAASALNGSSEFEARGKTDG